MCDFGFHGNGLAAESPGHASPSTAPYKLGLAVNRIASVMPLLEIACCCSIDDMGETMFGAMKALTEMSNADAAIACPARAARRLRSVARAIPAPASLVLAYMQPRSAFGIRDCSSTEKKPPGLGRGHPLDRRSCGFL